MDGTLEWNAPLDTPPLCNRSTRISAFNCQECPIDVHVHCIQFIKHFILPSIVKLTKSGNSFVYLLDA